MNVSAGTLIHKAYIRWRDAAGYGSAWLTRMKILCCVSFTLLVNMLRAGNGSLSVCNRLRKDAESLNPDRIGRIPCLNYGQLSSVHFFKRLIEAIGTNYK